MQNIIELDPANKSLVRTVQGETDYRDPVGIATLPLTLSDGRPNFSGAWTMGYGGLGMGMGMGMGAAPQYNEAGAAAQAMFNPVNDPAVGCEPPGLVRQAGSTPHPVRMTQNSDHVVLEYEEDGGRREIYLDGRGPATAESTNLGHSVARYDGDSLVIETTQLLGNYTGPNGGPLSDETTTVETYRRMDDPAMGSVLALEMVVTDPSYLIAAWTRTWRKFYSPGYEFIEVDCRIPPTYQAQ